MKNKTICCDIDGTVGDLGKAIMPYINKLHPNAKVEDITNYGLEDFLTKKQIENMFRDFKQSKSNLNMQVIQGSIWASHEIRNMGNKLYFITARNQYPEITEETMRWLTDNKYSFDGVATRQTDKYPICKELGVDLVIDDNPKIIEDMSSAGIPSLLFDQPWNQEVEEWAYVKRVKSWFEIADLFKK